MEKKRNRYFLQFIRENWELAILVTVAVVIFLSHLFYTLQTHQFPEMDEQHYTAMVGEFYRQILEPSLETPVKMLTYIPFRQPGFPLLIFPLLFLTGIENAYKTLLFSNVLFFLVTFFAIYFLGKELFGKTAGFFASILFVGYGWPLFYLHFTYSETATTCFMILSLLFLLKSDHFQNKKYTLLFAIALGFGILTRWVVPIFVAGPMIYIVFQVWRKNLFGKVFKHALIAGFIAMTIAALPYIVNAGNFFGQYVNDQLLGGELWKKLPESRKNHISLQSAAYYFKVFEQLNIFYFLLFLVGLAIQFISKKRKVFLLLAFVVPYIAFSFFTIIKDDRYVVPIYPILALMSGSIIVFLKGKIKVGLMVIFGLLGIMSFFGNVWGVGPMSKGLDSVMLPMPIGHPRVINFTSIVWPPTPNRTNADKIMDIIQEDVKKRSIHNPTIVTFFSVHPIDIGMYSINAWGRLKPYEIRNFVGDPSVNRSDIEKNLSSVFKNLDYLLLKNGQQIEYYFEKQNYKLLEAILKIYPNHSEFLSNFEQIGTVVIPYDRSTVSIYRRKSGVTQQVVTKFIDNVSAEMLKKN